MAFVNDCLNGYMDEDDLEEIDQALSEKRKVWFALTFDVVEVEVDYVEKVVKFFDVLNSDISGVVTFDEYREIRRARNEA